MSHIPPLSFKVATTLSAYRGVILSTTTAQTVIYPGAALDFPVGITLDTVKDTTSSIEVAGPGNIARLFFNDSCASGKLVALDTSGRGIPFVDATDGACLVGSLVSTSVAATGTIADVLIAPGFKAIP